jgi:hypothetical protein
LTDQELVILRQQLEGEITYALRLSIVPNSN